MIEKTARIALFAGLMAGVQLAGTSMAMAQDADGDRYAALLQQIADTRITLAQREVMLERQQGQVASLRQQIETAPATKDAVRGIVEKMTAEIEKQIEADIPFRKQERYARLDKLRELLADPETRAADLYRRAITLYDIEVNYGNSISAYTGDNPINPGRRLAACQEDKDSAACNLSKDQQEQLTRGATIEGIADSIKDGNYVHFGRMSFIYLDLDSREGFRWNQETNSWDALDGGDIITARKAVRIARGESAPGVVTAPITVQAAQ